jgi:hypothetical protein
MSGVRFFVTVTNRLQVKEIFLLLKQVTLVTIDTQQATILFLKGLLDLIYPRPFFLILSESNSFSIK